MEKYKEILEDILNNLDLLKNEYEYYKKEKEKLNDVHKDGRHIIEIANMDAIDMMTFTSKYRKKLRKRRKVIDNYQILRKIIKTFDDDFIEDTKKLYKKINYKIDAKNNRKYQARSKEGQELIDEFSKENDDLVKSPNKDDLEELKNKMEMRNTN